MLAELGSQVMPGDLGIADPHQNCEFPHLTFGGVGCFGDAPGTTVFRVVHEGVIVAAGWHGDRHASRTKIVDDLGRRARSERPREQRDQLVTINLARLDCREPPLDEQVQAEDLVQGGKLGRRETRRGRSSRR